jgi:hypothetical protein
MFLLFLSQFGIGLLSDHPSEIPLPRRQSFSVEGTASCGASTAGSVLAKAMGACQKVDFGLP